MKKITKEDIAAHIDKHVKPDTFIVLTAKQGIRLENDAWIPPREEAYERVVAGFMRRLSQEIYGVRRRRTKRIKNLATLEGRWGTRWHINICLKRPNDVSIDEFKGMVERAWSKSRWSEPVVYVKPIHGEAVRYILKEGPDSILVKSTHF